MNLNKVLIAGRLTADPAIKSTPAGTSVSTITLATNRTWTDKSGVRQEATDFHSVVLWGRQAEIAKQYAVRGSLLLIEGRLQTRSYQDKQGFKKYVTEVICERLQLGPRPQVATAPTNQDVPVFEAAEDEEIKPEDLPF